VSGKRSVTRLGLSMPRGRPLTRRTSWAMEGNTSSHARLSGAGQPSCWTVSGRSGEACVPSESAPAHTRSPAGLTARSYNLSSILTVSRGVRSHTWLLALGLLVTRHSTISSLSLGSWPTRISANYSNVLWLVDKFCVPWQTVPHVSVRAMSARWARLRITVHVAQR
jgi:hypothetical protein